MLKCIALDDEPIALDIIKVFCDKNSNLKLCNTFTQASLAKRYLMKFPVDLIFLDIQMPDINGIDFYRSIKQDTMVIFTTAYSEYAVEGFNVQAIDYLLKPIEIERFEQAVQKALDYSNFLKSSESKQNCLYIRSEYALVKIPFEDIIYCETMDDYVKIHRKEHKPVVALMTLTKLLNKLPQDDFIRVHRSYIVSFSKINFVRAKIIRINNVNIPIGVSYRAIFQKKIQQ